MTFRTAGVLILLAIAGCNDQASSSDRHEEWRQAVVALCEAVAHAETDREAAEDLFLDKAHDPLHDIADAATKEDRDTAARLLEAKNLVESRLETMTGPLRDDLEQLARRANDALEILDVESVGCVSGASR
jgi:hypothetical protein